jgi:hypothetical protein
MQDHDFNEFLTIYRRLSATLERYKQTPEELRAKADGYFHVLKRLELHEVRAKADAWLERETAMPKPAEWAGQIVRGHVVDVPQMPAVEAHEWLRAERQAWEGEACGCAECVAHGVAETPRRFVPLVDADDRDLRGRIGDRIVTRGEWIHGAALMRWCLAKEWFYSDGRVKLATAALRLAGEPFMKLVKA